MAISKQKKSEIYKDLEAGLKDAGSTVFVNFHGLSVAEVTELRKKLRESGVTYTVAKKTIAKKVLETQGYTGEIPELGGELALAYGEDQLAPAREINDFEKKFQNKISILGGVFEGAFLGRDGMKEIAMIPSRQVLLGMFVNVINSPIQGMVIALSALAEKKSA